MQNAGIELTAAQQGQLIAALGNAAALEHSVTCVRVPETHISYVLLTGQYAYKIKKAVNLGFLDFTHLAARRFFCEEELRLNRRFAPDLYLAMLSITGSVAQPRQGGSGAAIEYALKMREFPQEALADSILRRGELTPQDIDQLAAHVAYFHQRAEPAAPGGVYGTPEAVERPALESFAQSAALGGPGPGLAQLEQWTREQVARHAGLIAARKRQGFVREVHGDLHLGNIVRYRGQLQAFDVLEHQLKTHEPLAPDEMADSIGLDLHRLPMRSTRASCGGQAIVEQH